MPNINITVAGKIATNTTPGVAIVCGNSDYTVTFDLDEEWGAEPNRTARFVYYRDGLSLYQEKEFTGDTADVPVLSGIDYVLVGVYAGDLRTTTPARILCDRSILCGDPLAVPPTKAEQLQAQIGDLAFLETEEYGNLVAAINEVKRSANSGIFVGNENTPIADYKAAFDAGKVCFMRRERANNTPVVYNISGVTAYMLHLSRTASTGLVEYGYMDATGKLALDTKSYVDEITDTTNRDNVPTVRAVEALLGDGGGLSDTARALLVTILRTAVYTSDQSANIAALEAALAPGSGSGGGEVEPDEPGGGEPITPEKTLTSISATYSGGDVTAGTALNDLTGIVVTAQYSDGTSATVTEYTLSGTIAEGGNTVTVSYGGKTTTFTVTGVAEETGSNGTSFTPTWTENTYIDGSGNVLPYNGWYLSNEIDCSNYSILRFTTENDSWFSTPTVQGNTAKGVETGFKRLTGNSESNANYMGGNYSKEVWYDVSGYECVRIQTNTAGVYNNTGMVAYELEV